MSIIIRLTDPLLRVTPSTVHLKELAKLLSETENMLLSQIEYRGYSKKNIIVSLSAIENEGVSCVLGGGSLVEEAFESIATALSDGDFNALSKRSIKSLRVYTELAKKLGCCIEFCCDTTVCATIDYDTVIPHQREIIEYDTTLYAKVITVGNRNLSVKLELSDGHLITCKVDEHMAKQLGSQLFDTILLYGDKVIDPKSLTTTDFIIVSIDDNYGAYHYESTAEWLCAMRTERDCVSIRVS